LRLGRRSTRIEGGGRLTKKKGEGPMRRLLRAAVAAAVTVALCGQGFAQEYPAHTITLIVPYPPGGGVDAMARVVAEKLARPAGGGG
jgi:hypothetical protein